jgi:hypothetical protein
MIPNWVSGAAARDQMNRSSYGGGSSSGGGCTGGILSGFAIPVVALWGFAITEGSAMSTPQRLLPVAGIVVLAIWIGFGRFGKLGGVAKLAYSLLVGYAVYDLAHRDGGGGGIPGIIAFLVILADQISRKSRENS